MNSCVDLSWLIPLQYFLNDIKTSRHKLYSRHFTFQWKLLVTVLFFPTDSWNGWRTFLNGTAQTVPKADDFFWTDSSSRLNGWLERIAQTVRTADKFFWTASSSRSKTDDEIGTLWFKCIFLKCLLLYRLTSRRQFYFARCLSTTHLQTGGARDFKIRTPIHLSVDESDR